MGAQPEQEATLNHVLSPQGALRAGCTLTLTGLALALAACGGSGNDSATASSSAADRDTARVRLQECLRKQGVDLPTPGQGGGGQVRITANDRRKLEKAMQGPCKKYQQQAFGDISQEDRQEMRDQMVKFTSCMRKQGVDVPDLQPGQGGPPQRINLNSPRAKKATEACRKLLPQRRGGPGGGGINGPPPGGSQ